MREVTKKEYEQLALMGVYFNNYSHGVLTFESNYYKGNKIIAKICTDRIFTTKSAEIGVPWYLEDFELERCRWER